VKLNQFNDQSDVEAFLKRQRKFTEENRERSFPTSTCCSTPTATDRFFTT